MIILKNGFHHTETTMMGGIGTICSDRAIRAAHRRVCSWGDCECQATTMHSNGIAVVWAPFGPWQDRVQRCEER